MAAHVSKAPATIFFVVAAIILTVSFSAGILLASLSVTWSPENPIEVANPAGLSVQINTGSISITNEVDCVVRVAPISGSNRPTISTGWTLQENGWYYLNRVVPANENPTISTGFTNVSAENLVAELMQAQYSTDANGAATGGFILEWAERDVQDLTAGSTLGDVTLDGVDLNIPGYSGQDPIIMFAGKGASNRLPPSTGTAQDFSHFQATKSGSYYVFNQVRTAADQSFATIGSNNAIMFYNNTSIQVVYTIEIINGGHMASKDTRFTNGGNWTTYVDNDRNNSSDAWVLASSGSALSTGTTYIVSRPVNPGEYITLTDGSGDNQIYFDGTLTDDVTALRFAVSSVDSLTFYNSYLKTPNVNKYLSWLSSLGTAYYNAFSAVLTGNGVTS